MRDDFSLKVKELLAKRVGYRCSNPDCWQLTSGPQEDPAKTVNVGVASHITAASPDGPRYDESLTPEQRKSHSNGVWLCQKCAKLADNDPVRYSVKKLQNWKKAAEDKTIQEIEGTASAQGAVPTNAQSAIFTMLENLMSGLLDEMRNDLAQNPLRREFVLLKKSWAYWPGGDELAYYFEDHPELESKVRILQNHGLVEEITYTNVERYVISEGLADYLIRK